MRVLSLFSGIGGLDLGLERAGMTVVGQSEVDPYANRVLRKHWPDVPNLGDITKITEADLERLGQVDLVCGGPPCQPVSIAGIKRGIEDDRWLWGEFWRICGLVRPRFALAENPPAILSRPVWMGAVLGGAAACRAFRRVEWDCLPAVAFGAPHQRDRAFIVAYADNDNRHGRCGALQMGRQSFAGTIANIGQRKGTQWAIEPDVGRMAYGVSDRLGRLRGLGNAVVPQVAEHVGRIIMGAL